MTVDFENLVLGPCLEVFGRAVNYQPGAGDPFEVTGVFQAEHAMVETDGETVVSTTAPVLGVRLADFPGPPKKRDRVEIDGKTYSVSEVRPDGHGGAKLILKA